VFAGWCGGLALALLASELARPWRTAARPEIPSVAGSAPAWQVSSDQVKPAAGATGVQDGA
jgi:hypothetical protein